MPSSSGGSPSAVWGNPPAVGRDPRWLTGRHEHDTPVPDHRFGRCGVRQGPRRSDQGRPQPSHRPLPGLGDAGGLGRSLGGHRDDHRRRRRPGDGQRSRVRPVDELVDVAPAGDAAVLRRRRILVGDVARLTQRAARTPTGLGRGQAPSDARADDHPRSRLVGGSRGGDCRRRGRLCRGGRDRGGHSTLVPGQLHDRHRHRAVRAPRVSSSTRPGRRRHTRCLRPHRDRTFRRCRLPPSRELGHRLVALPDGGLCLARRPAPDWTRHGVDRERPLGWCNRSGHAGPLADGDGPLPGPRELSHPSAHRRTAAVRWRLRGNRDRRGTTSVGLARPACEGMVGGRGRQRRRPVGLPLALHRCGDRGRSVLRCGLASDGRGRYRGLVDPEAASHGSLGPDPCGDRGDGVGNRAPCPSGASRRIQRWSDLDVVDGRRHVGRRQGVGQRLRRRCDAGHGRAVGRLVRCTASCTC